MSFSFAAGLFWLSVACCALAQFFILRSVGAARRATPQPDATLPRQRGALEMVWAVLPAVGLAVLLVFTWRAIRSANADSPAPTSLERVGVPL